MITFKKRKTFMHLEISYPPKEEKLVISNNNNNSINKNDNDNSNSMNNNIDDNSDDDNYNYNYVKIMNKIQDKLKKQYINQIFQQIDILGIEGYERMYYVTTIPENTRIK